MSKILVTGNGRGLGAAITIALRDAGHEVFDYDLEIDGKDVRAPNLSGIDALDVLINNAGVNLIDWLDHFEPEQWDEVLGVNAKGIYMMTRACLPLLKASQGTVVNIVSNAALIPMTCSLAYNASKAAAHIMTLQLARELTKKWGITVFGIAPNKLAGTGMSASIDDQVVVTRGWTKEFAHEYQINGLLTREETPPYLVAEFLAFLLQEKERHRFLTGTIIPYGA